MSSPLSSTVKWTQNGVRSGWKPSNRYVLEGQTIDISTSCGVVCYPADSADVRELRILADQRMYEDKQKTGSSRSAVLSV